MAEPVKGSTVLLTGATGFVGKVVLYDLLRRRRELGVEKIFVLVRKNRKRGASERFEADIVGSPAFAGQRELVRQLVEPVEGDLAIANCGMRRVVRERITAEVTHIIHCAASVEFDLPLRDAARANIHSSLNVLALAKRSAQLQRMVAVSTAYVTPFPGEEVPVRERLVPLKRNPDSIFDSIKKGTAVEKALLKQTGHPNTYTFTKCVAEHLLAQRHGEVPLSIVRPSVISASLQYPEPGWIDSAAAFAGFVAMIGAGYFRALNADPATRIDVIPVDAVSAAVLDAAYPTEPLPDFDIRHATAGIADSCTNETSASLVVDYFREHPIDRRAKMHYIGPATLGFRALELAEHIVPSAGTRLWARVTKNSKLERQTSRLLDTQVMLNRVFPYFTKNTFDFEASRRYLPADYNRVEYVKLVADGVYRHLFGRDGAQQTIAGRQHKDGLTDLAWASRQSAANLTMRMFGYALRKTSRHCVDRVTFDHEGFKRAKRQTKRDELLVIVPMHRSYTDFLLCSYLFFTRPDLGVAIPHIAADSQFRDLPLLGVLFRQARAFYLQRGLGKADAELNRQVTELVENDETLQFFIEGARSRSRQFLTPKRGLLRCLQSTGRKFAILPVAITYDRIPEEQALLEEIAGLPKRKMQVTALMRWFAQVVRSEVQLGRIHVSAGELQRLGPDTDVAELSQSVMAQLQDAVGVTTYHLKAFAKSNPGVDEAWLRQELERRGATVLDSPLEVDETPNPVEEQSLRYQWMHRFFDDAAEELGADPAIALHLQRNHFTNGNGAAGKNGKSGKNGNGKNGRRRSRKMTEFLRNLFEPVQQDFRGVARMLRELHDADVIKVTPEDLKAQAQPTWSPNVETALDYFVDLGVLIPGPAGTFTWGEEAAELLQQNRPS